MIASFYTDGHIPYDVVKQPREHGVDVIRCEDIGMKDAKDFEHLTYAAQQGYIVITCDVDFTELHWEWLAEGREHSGILNCRQPELCTIANLVENALLIFEDPEGKESLKNTLWRVQK